MEKVTSYIIENLSDLASKLVVSDVRIGLGYTAVLLEDDSAGLAYTFRDRAQGGCSVFHAMRPISGRPASDLLGLLSSLDPIEAAVGLACANSIINRDHEELVRGDILDYLDLNPGDHVGMVGHFRPLVNSISERVQELTIFERIDEPLEQLRPFDEALDVLPECHVALITATSIINHTIDGLLAATKNCSKVAVIGASTPLLKEAFTGSNVTMLSGVVVEQPLEVLRVVSEGGGMRLFKPFIRKVNLIL